MARASIRNQGGPAQHSPTRNRSASHPPDVTFDDRARSIEVRDPRMFQASQRAFCRRLAAAAARSPGVIKVRIDLNSAACRLVFEPADARMQRMADVFAESVHQAAASPANEREFARRWVEGRWIQLTAYPILDDVSIWETDALEPGRLRIRNQSLAAGSSRRDRLVEALSHLDRVEKCRALPWSQAFTIDFNPDRIAADHVLDRVEQILEGLAAAETRERVLAVRVEKAMPDADEDPEIATGSRRLINLALAGGSFAMTLVAVIIPGIPFLPFLLATSYYLARSSPRMNKRLRRLPFLGAILVEWERYGRLSRLSKLKLIALTLVVILLSIVLIGLSPVAMAVMLLISSAMIVGILHAPEIAEQARGQLSRTRLALPAPSAP